MSDHCLAVRLQPILAIRLFNIVWFLSTYLPNSMAGGEAELRSWVSTKVPIERRGSLRGRRASEGRRSWSRVAKLAIPRLGSTNTLKEKNGID